MQGLLKASPQSACIKGVTYAQERENAVQKESIDVQKAIYLYMSILNKRVKNVIIYKMWK